MGERLKNKNAVVTGGAGGLGQHICLALAAEGANIVVNDVGAARDGSGTSTSPVDDLIKKLQGMGVKAIANYDSVVNFSAAEKLIQTCAILSAV